MEAVFLELCCESEQFRQNGVTAVHLACQHDQNNSVGVLAGEGGLAVGAVARGLGTPLHIASRRGNATAVELLL